MPWQCKGCGIIENDTIEARERNGMKWHLLCDIADRMGIYGGQGRSGGDVVANAILFMVSLGILFGLFGLIVVVAWLGGRL
jgi:hypothetical protein